MSDFKDIKKILKKLNIKSKNFELYDQALTHSSYAYENSCESNERLEFLGDAVLELLMSQYLYLKTEERNEGAMTKKRAQLVCEEALYAYANKIGLPKFLKLGKGEEAKGPSQAIIADAFEALIGAIFLDLGFGKAKDSFYKLVIPNMELVSGIKDFKTILQEYVQSDKRTLSYKIVNESGPSHDKLFEAAVYLDNDIVLGTGQGKTKKEAEQKAAEEALKKGNFHVD